MNTFDTVMDFVFRWEGGYVSNPNDPGGETNFGISKRAHPTVDIKNLTKEGAKEIYKRDYWKPIKGYALQPMVACVVMDYAVHSGCSRAVKALQGLVGTAADGKMGPKTLDAVYKQSDTELARAYVMMRSDFLCDIVRRKPDQAVFLKGWMRRTHDLMHYALVSFPADVRDEHAAVPETKPEPEIATHAELLRGIGDLVATLNINLAAHSGLAPLTEVAHKAVADWNNLKS